MVNNISFAGKYVIKSCGCQKLEKIQSAIEEGVGKNDTRFVDLGHFQDEGDSHPHFHLAVFTKSDVKVADEYNKKLASMSQDKAEELKEDFKEECLQFENQPHACKTVKKMSTGEFDMENGAVKESKPQGSPLLQSFSDIEKK